MAIDADIHVDDIGTEIRLTFIDQDNAVMDISGYEELKLLIKLPTDEVLTRTGVLYSDGVDGKMKYISVDGDFPIPGNYQFQGFVKLPEGQWHSEIKKRKVEKNL